MCFFFFFFLPSLSLSPPSLSLPPSHAHTFGLAQSCAIALPAVSHMVFFWGGGSGLCSFVDVVSVVIGYRLHQTSKLPPPARFCIIAKMFPLPPPFLCFFVCSFVSVGMCMLVNSAFLCSGCGVNSRRRNPFFVSSCYSFPQSLPPPLRFLNSPSPWLGNAMLVLLCLYVCAQSRCDDHTQSFQINNTPKNKQKQKHQTSQ